MSAKQRLGLAAGLLILACLVGGCSGLNASHSVSPASFFLPGLLYKAPETPRPGDPDLQPVTEFAVLSKQISFPN
jgi:hypothetical protein